MTEELLKQWANLEPERCKIEHDRTWIYEDTEGWLQWDLNPKMTQIAVQQSIEEWGWKYALTWLPERGKYSANIWTTKDPFEVIRLYGASMSIALLSTYLKVLGVYIEALEKQAAEVEG